jgi:CubicO group peptidase (beta-lactamase class C family)
MAPSPISASSSDDDLIGLWGVETISGPSLRGEVKLMRMGSRWSARIGTTKADGLVAGDSLLLIFPKQQGTLRIRLHTPANVMVGFWIQPVGNLTMVPYATPVRLSMVGANRWVGRIAPVDDRWTLFLDIKRHTDGTMRGAFRNPEINWTGGAPWFQVTRDGSTLRFADLESRQEKTSVGYDSAARRITMEFGRPILLRRLRPNEAAVFYSRLPTLAAYVYRAPGVQADGWASARSSSVGMDESRLQDLVRRVASTDPTGPAAPAIHAVLVARRGKLVLEEYFHGFDAARLHDLRSASKTITSVMMGAALAQGVLRDVEQPALSFFPFATDVLAQDPRKAAITVAHLLTHTSGLACDDGDDQSPGGEEAMQSQQGQRDWHRFVFDLPVVYAPGTHYAYCSGGLNLAAGVVHHSSGQWLPEFFEHALAQPLGITAYAINLTPTGEAYGGGGMQLRPRDLLKFGQLYLNDGEWHGRRVVSREWIRQSTSHQVDAPNGSSDGFAWHRYTLTVGGRRFEEYEANGNGGQYVFVVPELELVVAFTAGNYGQYGIWRKFREELLPQYIMSAIQSR